MSEPELLKTSELLARLELELGLVLDQSTIRAWSLREEHPVPVAYRGKNGQSHRFCWPDVLAWYLEEQDRLAASSSPAATDLDALDWHSARTISARERAKRDIIETRRIEGRYADVTTMRQVAEDRARHAVNLLRTLPGRVAPQLATMSDEVAIDHYLDVEIRSICQSIERAALDSLEASEEDPPQESAA